MLFHPFWVHFPIASWLMGTFLLWGLVLFKRTKHQWAAWFMLSIGAVSSLLAVWSGQQDYLLFKDPTNSSLELHRRYGTLLPWLMGPIVLIRCHQHFSKKAWKIPQWFWCLACGFVAGLLLYVGFLGGLLVYQEDILLRRLKAP